MEYNDGTDGRTTTDDCWFDKENVKWILQCERILFEWERLGERPRRQQETESCGFASWRPCALEYRQYKKLTWDKGRYRWGSRTCLKGFIASVCASVTTHHIKTLSMKEAEFKKTLISSYRNTWYRSQKTVNGPWREKFKHCKLRSFI
jgi:hypothetical protein